MYLTVFAMSFYYSSLGVCLHTKGPNVMAACIKFRSLKTAVFKQIINLFLTLSHSSWLLSLFLMMLIYFPVSTEIYIHSVTKFS